MNGTLFLVGVGPGDPELMTLKAARLLGRVPVIAYPLTETEAHLALDIAEAHCNPAAERLPLAIPMATRLPSGEFIPKEAAYRAAAEAISTRLAAGKDVAYLCEGDPLFYGSALYLLTLMQDRHAVSVIPGVTSVSAAAAAIAMPLVARSEALTVLAGQAPDEALRADLVKSGSVVLLKVGRHFDRVAALLEASGRAEHAYFVERASLPQQRIVRLRDLPPGPKPYFSLILCLSGAEFGL